MTQAKLDSKAMASVQKEAKRLLKEFEEYAEDLRLYSNPEFWEALRQKPGKIYKSMDEYKKEMGFR